MKKKTKQDFQETIKAEHGECCSVPYLCPPLPQSGLRAASGLGVPCVATALPALVQRLSQDPQ